SRRSLPHAVSLVGNFRRKHRDKRASTEIKPARLSRLRNGGALTRNANDPPKGQGGSGRAEAPASRDRRRVGGVTPRHPRPRLQRRIVRTHFPKSQRDSVTQPKVAESARLPWDRRGIGLK